MLLSIKDTLIIERLFFNNCIFYNSYIFFISNVYIGSKKSLNLFDPIFALGQAN